MKTDLENTVAQVCCCLCIRQSRHRAQAPHGVLGQELTPLVSLARDSGGFCWLCPSPGESGPLCGLLPPCGAGVGDRSYGVCQPSHRLSSCGAGQPDSAGPAGTPGPTTPRPVLRELLGKVGVLDMCTSSSLLWGLP